MFMKKKLCIFYKFLAIIILLNINIACKFQSRLSVKDHLSMEIKEINYTDKNCIVTIEFQNISSEICEFGDSSASINYTHKIKLAKGIIFYQGGYAFAIDHKFEILLTLQPKKRLTIQVPLEISEKNLPPKNQFIRYFFTYIRIGNNTPQYGIYELESRVTPVPESLG